MVLKTLVEAWAQAFVYFALKAFVPFIIVIVAGHADAKNAEPRAKNSNAVVWFAHNVKRQHGHNGNH
jgi:hypothetical protein